MAINQTGIAISIKAFLPTGKTLDENLNALLLVKNAQETGDFSAVLAAAQIDEIKSEQKTRRIEIAPEPVEAIPHEPTPDAMPKLANIAETKTTSGAPVEDETPTPSIEDVPFKRSSKGLKAEAAQ